MASPTVHIGTGASIAFATSAYTAEILSFNHSGISRESIQTSHLGTTSDHTFVPGDLVDNGELSMEVNFNPDTSPPILTNAATETITVTIPGSTVPATWVFSGFATGFEYSVPFEDKMTATLTVKVAGSIAINVGT